MARIAQYVVALEEVSQSFDPLTGGDKIPERERICGTGVNLIRDKREVWLQCSYRKWQTQENDEIATGSGLEQEYSWEYKEALVSW
jgi:hypothetical protein